MCDWCAEPVEVEALERLRDIACDAGIHDTKALGRCPHSPARPPLMVPGWVVRDTIDALLDSLVVTRNINRAYDSRREPDFGPLGSAWTRENDLGRPA